MLTHPIAAWREHGTFDIRRGMRRVLYHRGAIRQGKGRSPASTWKKAGTWDGFATCDTLHSVQASATESKIKPGSHLAFQAIFESELRYVWNTLRYLGVRSADLEDVAHEVFLTVLRLLETEQEVRSIKSWLYKLCYHAASNYRRKARHERELLDDDPDTVDAKADPESQVGVQEELALVAAALDRLDLDRRAVLVMHDIHGCVMPEVANTLEIPLATAYSRLRLARRDFQEAVASVRAKGGEHVS